MRVAKTWLSVVIALLLLPGTFMIGGAHAVQDEPELDHAVAVHAGTCDEFDQEPAYDLGVASPEFEEADDVGGGPPEVPEGVIGFPGAAPVATSNATIDATFDDVFTDDPTHSLVVRAGPDLEGEAEACGELGGVEVDGRIVIALQPVNDSGFAGVSVFDEDDAGFLGLGEDEVNVTVYVLGLEQTAEEVDATTPEPAEIEDPEEGYAQTDWLVDVSWLDEQIDPETTSIEDRDDLVVVGVFPRDESGENLVPGTAIFEPGQLALTDTSEESIDEWRQQTLAQILPLGQTGDSSELEEDHTVLIYDDGSLDGAALWWALDYFGHEDKRMLNGGLEAWTEESELPIDAAPPASTGPGVVPEELPEALSGGLDPDVLATIDEVESALEDPDVVLVDARSPEEYDAGHLPGAVNIPATENVESGDAAYWADAQELRQLYADAGVTTDLRVIAYGGEGFSPHVTYFTLQLLGYEDVAVYPGGWVEWSQYPSLPRESSE